MAAVTPRKKRNPDEPESPEEALALALARAHMAELRVGALSAELARQEAIAGGFVARVSHELRTPLNVVLGFASLARDGAFGEPEPPMAEALDKVLDAAERLAGLLGDLLDARRMEEGVPPLDLAPLEPAAWLQALVDAVAPLLKAKGQSLHLKLEAGLPPSIWADHLRLNSVLAALLDNASKFSPPHSQLQLEAAPLGGEGLRLTLIDHGEGIPPQAMPRIFERFFQADGSSTRKHGGTGLGLALAKSVVEAHGGRIQAKDTPGGGATFTVELPASPPEDWVG